MIYSPPSSDPESVVRFGGNHLRPLPGALLDVLRGDADRQGCDQDAHSEGVRGDRVQRGAHPEGHRHADEHSGGGQDVAGAVQDVPAEPEGASA